MELASTLKRKRDDAPRVAPGLRVSIDTLMQSLRSDPTLQVALDEDAWLRLVQLQSKYAEGILRQRAFVDAVGAIVGTMKLCKKHSNEGGVLVTNDCFALRS